MLLTLAEDNPSEYAADRGPQYDYGDEDIELYTGKYASGGIAGMLGNSKDIFERILKASELYDDNRPGLNDGGMLVKPKC